MARAQQLRAGHTPAFFCNQNHSSPSTRQFIIFRLVMCNQGCHTEFGSSLSSFLPLKFAGGLTPCCGTLHQIFSSAPFLIHARWNSQLWSSDVQFKGFFPLLRPAFFKCLQIRQLLGALIVVFLLSQRHYLLFQFLSCFISYYVESFWKLYLPFKSHIPLSRREFEKVGVKRKHKLKQPQHSSLQH